MKIWYQSAARFGIDNRWRSYERSLKKHISSLLSLTSTFFVKGIDSEAEGYQDQNSLDEYRQQQFFQNAMLAESQGFTAFAIGCWKDYSIVSIRQNTKLLIVSIAEASLHASLILGRRPGLIIPSVHYEAFIKENLKFYGIEKSNILFSTCDIDMETILNAFENPAPFYDNFIPCANRLIGEGADVILVGWGVFNEILYSIGLRNIRNIPILDSIAALIGTITFLGGKRPSN